MSILKEKMFVINYEKGNEKLSPIQSLVIFTIFYFLIEIEENRLLCHIFWLSNE